MRGSPDEEEARSSMISGLRQVRKGGDLSSLVIIIAGLKECVKQNVTTNLN
jgi:hypothetical protein